MDPDEILFSSNNNTLKVFLSDTGSLAVPSGGGSTDTIEIDHSAFTTSNTVWVLAYTNYRSRRYSTNSRSINEIGDGFDSVDFTAWSQNGTATIQGRRVPSGPQNNNAINLDVRYFLISMA